MARAFQEVFGVAPSLDAVPMAGRTDPWIAAQMAVGHDLACDGAAVRRFRQRTSNA
jgi:hypothetical protein